MQQPNSYGLFTLGAGGELWYTPSGFMHSPASFTYTVEDVWGNSSTTEGIVRIIARPQGSAQWLCEALHCRLWSDSTGTSLTTLWTLPGGIQAATDPVEVNLPQAGTYPMVLEVTDVVGTTDEITFDVQVSGLEAHDPPLADLQVLHLGGTTYELDTGGSSDDVRHRLPQPRHRRHRRLTGEPGPPMDLSEPDRQPAGDPHGDRLRRPERSGHGGRPGDRQPGRGTVMSSATNKKENRRMNLNNAGLTLAALVLLVATSGPFSAQAQNAVGASAPSAAMDRGFKPEQAYDFGELDSVNLFNGNLTVTLPIGGTYPVGPDFSYGLTLVYNSNIWDYEYQLQNGSVWQDCDEPWLAMGYDSQCQTKGGPTSRSNAGLGWTLTLGELLEPGTPGPQNPWNRSGRWLYTTADGGSHSFYTTLHDGVSNPGGALYSRDGSYLRLRELGTGDPAPAGAHHGGHSVHRVIESTDGTRHVFYPSGHRGRWLLEEIRDPHGNHLILVQEDADTWRLEDSHGRVHRIHYESDPHSLSGQRVTQVDLAASANRRAFFDFNYHAPSSYRPACSDTAIGVTQELFSLELLSSVTPHGGPVGYLELLLPLPPRRLGNRSHAGPMLVQGCPTGNHDPSYAG